MKLICFFCALLISLASYAMPKVSVICPTYDRPERHADLYAIFTSQTYENRELLILDDSPMPSPFFMNLDDPRVIYRHSFEKTSIGLKRNALIAMASGEIIAHFDDDDYYAPCFLETMITKLGDADFIKLCRWFAWREVDNSLWEWDGRFVGDRHYVVSGENSEVVMADVIQNIQTDPSFNVNFWLDANTWGFGFSYVYRKSLAEECLFEDTSAGEDYLFTVRARELKKKLIHVPDFDHIALHLLHNRSTSYILPQYHHHGSVVLEMFGEQAAPWLMK